MKNKLVAVGVTILSLVISTPAQAAVTIDYTHDAATDNFFGTNLIARTALEAAVADINAVLNLNLAAITNDTTVGMSTDSSSTTTFDFRYNYTNPNTGDPETIADTTMPANEIRIFAGMRPLSGNTLGQGGPAGIGWSAGFSSTNSSTIPSAIADVQGKDQHRRGSGPGNGPTITTASGTLDSNPYSFDIGPTVGNLWFDNDTDNMGGVDDATTLEANWHFDHTTAVASGKDDFYSVALHEVLHSIGFGTSDTWDSLITGGDDWTGTEVLALLGSGADIIDTGGGHIASGIMSTRLSDGMMQEVVMDPEITQGTRKFLTALDAAFLRDIGFSTASAVPEPSSIMALAIVGGGMVMNRRRKTKTAEKQGA